MTPFGTASTGEKVHRHTIGAGDLTVSFIDWGAALQDLRLAGVDHSLTIGSDDLSDYEGDMKHHGSLIGPVVNRISTGRIRIDGMDYELERNQDSRITLHSGRQATHRRLWKVTEATDTAITFTITLMDGECGLPGNRRITARYAVEAPATLALDITGETDARTPLNFANHSYWNLDGSDNYGGHRLQVLADHVLPITGDATPTGEIASVEGTEMDFREPRRIAPHDPELDNNFCLSDAPTDIRRVLTLSGRSGVTLDVATDQPGIQVFDNRPDYRAIAIEAQNWPDAPTWPAFPSIMVEPGRPYRQRTRWTFRA